MQGFACTFVCNSARSVPGDPMSALEGAPGCDWESRSGSSVSAMAGNGRKVQHRHVEHDGSKGGDTPDI